MRMKIYRDRRKEWRWTLTARNGRKLANSGEGYKRRADCQRMAQLIGGAFTVCSFQVVK